MGGGGAPASSVAIEHAEPEKDKDASESGATKMTPKIQGCQAGSIRFSKILDPNPRHREEILKHESPDQTPRQATLLVKPGIRQAVSQVSVGFWAV